MAVERYVVAFRRLPSEGINNCEVFKLLGGETYTIRQQIIPGMNGKPDMFVRYDKARYGNKRILIVSYTEEEINYKLKLDITDSLLELLVRERIIAEDDLK